jgi:hypothetical protein
MKRGGINGALGIRQREKLPAESYRKTVPLSGPDDPSSYESIGNTGILKKGEGAA